MVDFFTTRQLQEILHVDRTTIYRMAEAGRLPGVKVGNQWRFPRRPIDQWLDKQDAAPALAQRPGPAVGDISQALPLDCVQLIQDSFADALGIIQESFFEDADYWYNRDTVVISAAGVYKWEDTYRAPWMRLYILADTTTQSVRYNVAAAAVQDGLRKAGHPGIPVIDPLPVALRFAGPLAHRLHIFAGLANLDLAGVPDRGQLPVGIAVLFGLAQ
mgnify:CR=1 FL=1